MSPRIKIAIFGVSFLAVGLLLYVFVRFKYIEKDIIESYIITTNRVIEEYKAYEKKVKGRDDAISARDLSAYLKIMHKKHGNIALMALTDDNLAVRLSSKNSRYITSSYLFESILKDYTRENLNDTGKKTYAVRYYSDAGGGEGNQNKYYLFLRQIGPYRLLVAYPYAMSDRILVRTVLELALLVVISFIVSLIAYLSINGKRSRGKTTAGPIIIDLGVSSGLTADDAAGAARHTSRVASESLVEFVHGQFITIHDLCNTQSISLYIAHGTGKLIKTMELMGNVFMKIDSLSFDTVDLDNDVGEALREGSTIILEDGRKLLLPMIYNGSFLGAVILIGKELFQGTVIQTVKEKTAGILKNLNDLLALNDVMIDSGSGLHSKTYFHFKYDESLKSWKNHGKHFSLIFIELFNKNVQIDDDDKNRIMKVIAPAIMDCVKNGCSMCRYDDCIALVLLEMNMRMAQGLATTIKSMLARYRIKEGTTSIGLNPAINIASTDSAIGEMDILARVKEGLTGCS